MQSLRRIFPQCIVLNFAKSTSILQVKTASFSSASVAYQENHTLLSQLKERSTDWNIPTSTIRNVVKLNPHLLEHPPSEWDSLFNTLSSIGFGGTEFLNMVRKCPDLLTADRDSILEIWKALTIFRLDTRTLVLAINANPYVLLNSPLNARDKAEAILNFVGFKNNSKEVLMNCENVFSLSLQELQKVIEYVEVDMKVRRKHEICRSRAVECPLGKLKMRHTFLVLCGLYTPQDDDIPVTIPHSNPLLNMIIDTSDEVFATQTAKVTLEEYIVYQDLCDKKLCEDIYGSIDD